MIRRSVCLVCEFVTFVWPGAWLRGLRGHGLRRANRLAGGWPSGRTGGRTYGAWLTAGGRAYGRPKQLLSRARLWLVFILYLLFLSCLGRNKSMMMMKIIIV